MAIVDLGGRTGRHLAGQVALVTGCGQLQGIGRAVALDFARAGADVAVTDLQIEGVRNIADANEAERAVGWRGLPSLVEELVAMRCRAVAPTGNVGEETAADRAADASIAALRKVDILVNNAVAPHGDDRGANWEIPIASFDQVMRINARGTFLMCRPVIRHSLARRSRGGNSRADHQHFFRGGQARRAQTCRLLRIEIRRCRPHPNLAQELGAVDITVNAVCPGAIATARGASREKCKAEAGVQFEFVKSAVPRVGTGDDIARAVTFLAQPAASFVTGQSIMKLAEW